MDRFSSFFKSTTEQVTNLGKFATDMINSIATCSPLTDPQVALPPPGENATDKKECSSTSSSDAPVAEDTTDDGDISKVILTSAKSFGSAVTKSTLELGSSVFKKGKEMVNQLDSSAQEITTKQVNLHEDDAVSLWVGLDVKEKEVKEKILALSSDRRNFLRPPPIDTAFNLEASAPMAQALLKVDESLQEMRYLLVPKEVNEESFWRNYFYRISLIKLEASMEDISEPSSNDAAELPANEQSDAMENTDNSTTANTLEECAELVNDLADLELETIEALDDNELNLELSDFKLSSN